LVILKPGASAAKHAAVNRKNVANALTFVIILPA